MDTPAPIPADAELDQEPEVEGFVYNLGDVYRRLQQQIILQDFADAARQFDMATKAVDNALAGFRPGRI